MLELFPSVFLTIMMARIHKANSAHVVDTALSSYIIFLVFTLYIRPRKVYY